MDNHHVVVTSYQGNRLMIVASDYKFINDKNAQKTWKGLGCKFFSVSRDYKTHVIHNITKSRAQSSGLIFISGE